MCEEHACQHIQELKLIPKYILNTHGHIDHIAAIDAVSAVYPVPLAIHPDDVHLYTDERVACMYSMKAPLVKRKPDILLKEGDHISFGTLTLEVLHTPGHTPGSSKRRDCPGALWPSGVCMEFAPQLRARRPVR